ncbi:hypothetical protein AKJ37_07740 [candidate division MSBL1 archaeon SCGC-AAA259I09]|uniref:Uncharacterized protein n=1 Tax=candidate division MSBL1 archaeon SCGC-AAA259I09 TaxID=1698267 RepID=A0A133UJC4_9EURY|nr:hypothetical protein AKJ37_07740 [candidate division MSBL1 archaeon SCGC-AAA259I09]
MTVKNEFQQLKLCLRPLSRFVVSFPLGGAYHHLKRSRKRNESEGQKEERAIGKKGMSKMRIRDGEGGGLARRLARLPELPPLGEERGLSGWVIRKKEYE